MYDPHLGTVLRQIDKTVLKRNSIIMPRGIRLAFRMFFIMFQQRVNKQNIFISGEDHKTTS